jgi:hypothetical protein
MRYVGVYVYTSDSAGDSRNACEKLILVAFADSGETYVAEGCDFGLTRFVGSSMFVGRKS